MKKALVILKDGTLINAEYREVSQEYIFQALERDRFIRFSASNTILSVDTIARIEWID